MIRPGKLVHTRNPWIDVLNPYPDAWGRVSRRAVHGVGAGRTGDRLSYSWDEDGRQRI